MRASLGLVEFELGATFDDRFAVAHVGVDDGAEVELHRFSVEDAHHVRRIRLLQPTRFVQLIEDCVWVGVVLDLDDDADSFLARFIADVPDSLHDLLRHQFRDALQHTGFPDLIRNRCDDDALAVRVVSDLGLGADVESTLAGSVHVDDSVDSVDHRSRREIGSFEVFHIFQNIDLRWLVERPFRIFLDDHLGVECDRRCDLFEVVRRNLGRHADGDSITAVEQQIRQARG